MSKYIANYMNLEKSKRPTFWNGGSTFKANPDTCYIYIVGLVKWYING